ncbi:MAG: ABC-F family ATP-binding cassette domain-containing protein [Prevotellaceae bacterium]|nr:ABC-F family ATP-binding cassette domain-containing protein [Prevotellaceae bacterium]
MVSIEHLTIEFSARPLLTDVSFVVNPKDRIALVGKNGAGKSTLLKTIAGQQRPTSGVVAVQKGVTVGYLPQVMRLDDGRTVMQEAETAFADVREQQERIAALQEQIAERDDYESDDYMQLLEAFTRENDRLTVMGGQNYRAELERTLQGLGFRREDFDRPTSEFSGGWRMRIELAKLLLRQPDLLLLDEPTNHLDIGSIRWLEQFLAQRAGAVILVSHDRAFVNNVTSRTIEITCGRINDYRVRYDEYVVLREERRATQLRAYENQQREIAEARDFIERFRYKPTKSNQVQSRIRMLEKIVPVEIDEVDTSRLHLKFPPCERSGDYPVLCDEVGKRYGDHQVLSGVNLTIRRGEKVAFVGNNGEGKSTLVKCIMDEIPFDGQLKVGHNVQIGYFAQNQAQLLDDGVTVFDTIDRVARGDMRLKIRDLLGAFMFGGEASDKLVRVLSGGERSRLAMIRLLLEPVNFLILDEPTNHLDMQSKDVLKQAIQQFDGTAIIVSHDRDFLDGLVERVYEFAGGRVREYIGGIYDYLSQTRDASAPTTPSVQRPSQPTATAAAADEPARAPLTYQEQKEQAKRVRRAQKAVADSEVRISTLEQQIADIEQRLSTPEGAADSTLFVRHSELQRELDEAMAEWERSSEELELLKTNSQ